MPVDSVVVRQRLPSSTTLRRPPRIPAVAGGVDSASISDTISSFHPAAPCLPAPTNIVSPLSAANMQNHRDISLVLQDSSIFHGYGFGANVPVSGECVFQTGIFSYQFFSFFKFFLGMVGYPESLTDPSYRGQLLVLTYPLIGNYGVPAFPPASPLLATFESAHIHAAALIIGNYQHECFSHHSAKQSLSAWLESQGVPGIYGVDTRALTKRIREHGVMLAKLVPGHISHASHLALDHADLKDPNTLNLVAQVSITHPKLFSPKDIPDGVPQKYAKDGSPLRILAIDVGMKFNQIRCFLRRGVELLVVPWDYDFVNTTETYHGLFISNGPGDPTMVKTTIDRLGQAMQARRTPIFGYALA